MDNLLNYTVTVREILELYFFNGVLFIPLFALFNSFLKHWSVKLTQAKIKRANKMLEQAKVDLKQSKVSFDGHDKAMFIFSITMLLLDLLLKL